MFDYGSSTHDVSDHGMVIHCLANHGVFHPGMDGSGLRGGCEVHVESSDGFGLSR